MLNLKEIQNQYPEFLRPFKRFILREYLQYKILEIVFNGPFANKLCFLGGTCLRIIHDQQRFSEDLDFDNFNLTVDEFNLISKNIETKLILEGYEVECKEIIKGAFHCYIRFPKILFNEGLTGHLEEKILIQLDTESQDFQFKPETFTDSSEHSNIICIPRQTPRKGSPKFFLLIMNSIKASSESCSTKAPKAPTPGSTTPSAASKSAWFEVMSTSAPAAINARSADRIFPEP